MFKNLIYYVIIFSDSHSWNQIADTMEHGKGIKGLDTWLADVVVGKDYHGLIKPIIKEIGQNYFYHVYT